MLSADNPNPEVFSKGGDTLPEEELKLRREKEQDPEVEDPIDRLEGTQPLTQSL